MILLFLFVPFFFICDIKLLATPLCFFEFFNRIGQFVEKIKIKSFVIRQNYHLLYHIIGQIVLFVNTKKSFVVY